MIYTKKRGQSVAYRFYSSPFGKEPYKNRLGVLNMKLPGYGYCQHRSCLRCKHSGIARQKVEPYCMIIRARYERKKREYLAEQAKASEEKRNLKEEKAKRPDYDDLNKKVDWAKIDKLGNGRSDPKSIIIYLKDTHGIVVGESAGKMIRALHEKMEKKAHTPEQ